MDIHLYNLSYYCTSIIKSVKTITDVNVGKKELRSNLQLVYCVTKRVGFVRGARQKCGYKHTVNFLMA